MNPANTSSGLTPRSVSEHIQRVMVYYTAQTSTVTSLYTGYAPTSPGRQIAPRKKLVGVMPP